MKTKWCFIQVAALIFIALSHPVLSQGTSKTSIKLYLMAGQSNMVGNGDNNVLPGYLQQQQHNVPIKVFGTVAYNWGPTRPGLGSVPAVFGPEVTFAYDKASANQNQQIGIIKGAWSGTNLNNQWRSPSSGGNPGELYTTFMANVTQAIVELEAQYEVEVAGFCWMQGESDASDLTMANAYQTNLIAFINDIRQAFNKPNLPFVIAMIDATPSWPYNAIVRQAQENVSNSMSNVFRFDTQNYPTDGSHYYAEGYMQLGSDFAQMMPVDNTSQVPYNGIINLPGVIEAENYDHGGQGVAYHDTESINHGGEYRTSEGVDIQSCSEGGFNVGWTSAGEWLEYTVNVPTAGSYTIDARVASPTGGSFHIDFGTTNVTGATAVPNTGGYQTWQTVSKTVNLSAGQQIVRFVIDQGGFNFNKITVSTAGGTGQETGGIVSGQVYRLVARNSGKVLDVSECSTADGANVQQWSWLGGNCQRWKVEATDNGFYRLISQQSGQALDVNECAASDGANVQQWPWSGADCQQWKIEPTDNGYHRLVARHSGKVLDVSGCSASDGASVHQWTWYGGDCQQWKLEAVAATQNTIAPKINNIPVKTMETTDVYNASLAIFPNPTDGSVSFEIESFEEAELTVLNSLGELAYRKKVSENSVIKIETSDFKPGTYIVILKNRNTSISKKLIIK